MKKAQGMSMQTIVIIILAVIILAAVTILFFTQFGANKKNFGNFSDVGSNKTDEALTLAAGSCDGTTTTSTACGNFCEGSDCTGTSYNNYMVTSCTAVGCSGPCDGGTGCDKGKDRCVGDGVYSKSITPSCDAITEKSSCLAVGCQWES